ncbi:unnamed protein product [Didymodactylos carnosus]|uniref:Uncharacterized protein n=1 Tax=Didymodactylos carnosus TaxID=1234261 RepID=A0A8S2WGS8_9BILA|nr:unnamed protein product [Didymodactylos carnosus]
MDALKSLARLAISDRNGEVFSQPESDSVPLSFSSFSSKISQTVSPPTSAIPEQKSQTEYSPFSSFSPEKLHELSFSQPNSSSSSSSLSSDDSVNSSTTVLAIPLGEQKNLAQKLEFKKAKKAKKKQRKLEEKEKNKENTPLLLSSKSSGFATTILKLESKIKENAISSNASASFYTIKRGCATAKGKLLGTVGIFTLDTGACVSIVSSDYWRLLKGTEAILRYSSADIVCPEGSSIEPVGWTEADVTLAGQTVRHSVILARKFNQKLLLGTDFMFEIGLVLDTQDRRYWLRDKPLAKFLLSTDLHQSGRLDIPVYAVEKKRLRPFHQAFVSVRTPPEISDRKWEATTTCIGTRLSTANSIVTVDKNITSVMVANLTPR